VFKKLLSSLLIACFLLISVFSYFPRVAHAQAQWYYPSIDEWYSKVYDEAVSPPNEIFGERYTAAQINWIIWSLLTFWPTQIVGPGLTTCAISILPGGSSIGDCIEGLVSNAPQVESVASLAPPEEKPLLAKIFEERSLSGITYVKNVARKFKIIPEVKAQEGFGFTEALLPIQEMWRASRDISYGLFVFVALILAFMVMFRVKISPQVVISAQSALPKILIAVVLVTFSYAIAGFLIDLMYVVIGLLSLLGSRFFPAELSVTPTIVFNFLTLGQPLSLNIPVGVYGLFATYIILFAIVALLVIGFTAGALVTGITAGLTAGLLVALFPTGFTPIVVIIGLLIFLVVFVILFTMFFKTLFMLFKAYAGVILLTIFAPFQILIGAVIPSMGFGRWVRSFVANLVIFVVTGVIFLLAFTFLAQAFVSIGRALGADNPTLGGLVETLIRSFLGTGFTGGAQNLLSGTSSAAWPPLLTLFGGSSDTGVAFLFLGVSFILFTLVPKTADIIQGLISGRPFAYGTAIGEAIGAGPQAIMGGMGVVAGAGKAYGGLREMNIIKSGGAQELGSIQYEREVQKRLHDVTHAARGAEEQGIKRTS